MNLDLEGNPVPEETREQKLERLEYEHRSIKARDMRRLGWRFGWSEKIPPADEGMFCEYCTGTCCEIDYTTLTWDEIKITGKRIMEHYGSGHKLLPRESFENMVQWRLEVREREETEEIMAELDAAIREAEA